MLRWMLGWLESSGGGVCPRFPSLSRAIAKVPMKSLSAIVLLGSILTGAMIVGAAAQTSTLTDKRVEALALQWFEQMRTGQIDRTQLTVDYSAQFTDKAVKTMSAYLNRYGASPSAAKILLTRTIGNQTFYDVKLLFPRGDAASFLFSFDTQGKIAGIALVSMAGD